MSRTIAIGDIHGCAQALAKLIEMIRPSRDDTIVTLGDYINRGPDSPGVLDRLIELQGECRLVPLLGNHEEMLLSALKHSLAEGTINDFAEALPARHLEFLGGCAEFYEVETHFFVHANYRPDVPVNQLDRQTRHWLSLRDYTPPKAHCSGKVAIVGHTPQSEILDLGYLKCIDTRCWSGGWLTALEVVGGRVWQVNAQGKPRNS